MLNRADASLKVHFEFVFDELAVLKWNIRLITLAKECEDFETIQLLLDCFEPRFNCQVEEIEYALKSVEKKVIELLKNVE